MWTWWGHFASRGAIRSNTSLSLWSRTSDWDTYCGDIGWKGFGKMGTAYTPCCTILQIGQYHSPITSGVMPNVALCWPITYFYFDWLCGCAPENIIYGYIPSILAIHGQWCQVDPGNRVGAGLITPHLKTSPWWAFCFLLLTEDETKWSVARLDDKTVFANVSINQPGFHNWLQHFTHYINLAQPLVLQLHHCALPSPSVGNTGILAYLTPLLYGALANFTSWGSHASCESVIHHVIKFMWVPWCLHGHCAPFILLSTVDVVSQEGLLSFVFIKKILFSFDDLIVLSFICFGSSSFVEQWSHFAFNHSSYYFSINNELFSFLCF